MKKSNITVEVYEIGSWVIYIEEDEKNYGAYLRHKNCGVSDFMFGVLKDNETRDTFLDLVMVNLGRYISYYTEDNMDDYDVDMLGNPIKEVE